MRTITIFALACLTAPQALLAQTVYTAPSGYVSVTCPSNSDTIVGLPLRKAPIYAGALGANPDTVTVPGSAVLTFTGTPGFTASTFVNSHYVKFTNTLPTPAAGDGQWFLITANTTSTITVDLNGGSIAAVSGASLEVIKLWTLNELFPYTACTTDPTTTGNAVVASTNIFANGRRTEILSPNLAGQGINLAPTDIYFVHSGNGWRKNGAGNTDFGTTPLWPDAFFIIRNPATVTSATTYTVAGEVEMNSMVIPLATYNLGAQDNFIGTPRAVDVTLSQLNLGNTSGFVSSTNLFANGRKDEILVYNNAVSGMNKSPSAIYFYLAGSGWRKNGDGIVSHDSTVIPAASGFIVRKSTGDGSTKFWNNTAGY